MRPARPRLLSLLAVLMPLAAGAFSVPAHEALTQAAIDSALEAGGPAALGTYRATLVEASRAEDLNLHVKWTSCNHFFHPGETLNTGFRRDSAARVRELWEEAEEAASHGDLERAFDRAGHLAHHIQDMAVPLHVVPVMHGLSDRFEQYGVVQALARATRREIAPLSGADAQLALARETVEEVRTGTLPAEGGAIPWSAFWAEASQPGTFGHYGEAGNAFGLKEVHWKGRAWTVEPSAYEDFVGARAEAAVAYSRAFLLFAAERFATLAESRSLAMRPQWRPASELSLELMGGAAVTAPRGATPLAGVRALLPLPWAMGLSAGYARVLGNPLTGGGNAWSLSVLSPPLLTTRLGYAGGLDLRATVGAGLYSQLGGTHPELPVGLRLHARLGNRLALSAEAQYRAFAPASAPWAQGVTFTVGTGYTWGDN